MSVSEKLKKFFGPVDMTTGTPWKKIVTFAIPMVIGNLAQQLYNTVDSIVVGKFVGDNALAAVGSAGPIYNLLLVLFVGISTGSSIVVSQYVGAKDRENLSKCIGASVILSFLTSLIIMILGPIVARPLLTLLKTPESIIDWCTTYLIIMLLGMLGCSFYNILSGVLRGLGDSLSALLFLLVATGLNIVLDIVFVAVIKMDGVSGVALATVIAQFVSAVLCFIKLSKMKEFFDLKWKYVRFNGHHTSDIVKLGLPSGIAQAIFSMAMILVQSLTNSFGETIIAANVIVMRVDGFAMMPVFSFSAALTTYAGQNFGAKKPERIYKGGVQGTLASLAVSIVLVSVILIFGKQIMGLFTETDELVAISRRFMSVLAVGYLMMAVSQSFQGIMRGCGDTLTPMWIGILTTVVVRVPVAYLLRFLTISEELLNGNFIIIPLSLLIAWIFGAIISLIFYLKGKWRKAVNALK